MNVRDANPDLIRAHEKHMPETPHEGADLTEDEWVIYSALLATDTDTYHGSVTDLPRRARTVAALLAGVPLTLNQATT